MVKKSSTTNNTGTMEKSGGTKRKIPIEKIEKKESRAITFSKRIRGLYSKASQRCLLSGSQIAILVTPNSSDSKVSFNSFGHSSVEAVVSAYLSGHHLGLGFWWDEKIPDTPEDLRHALNSISKLITDPTALRDEKLIMEQQLNDLKIDDQGTHELDQTLNLPQSSDCLNKTETEFIVLDDDFDHDDEPAAFSNIDHINFMMTQML